MRTEEIKVRLTPNEKTIIQDIARKHRTTCADLIRYQVLGSNRVRRLPDRDILSKLHRQISGIGTNINQMAMRVNEASQRDSRNLSDEVAIELLQSLARHKAALGKIAGLLSNSLGQ